MPRADLAPVGGLRAAVLPRVALRGMTFHAITERHCVRVILDELDQHRGGCVVTMNLDHLRRFVKDEAYSTLCREATIATADGMPLIWASRVQRTPLPERVTGSNLIWSLSAEAAKRRKSVFLLGGAPGVGSRAAEMLSAQNPGLRIAGTSSESINSSNLDDVVNGLAARLASAAPDIVYVALGSPKQEQVIGRLRHILPHAWWLGVGIAFSFVSGEIRRAPLWMQRGGLEWLHRLMQEPARLTHRYVIAGLPFATALLCSSALARFRKTELPEPEPANHFSGL